MSNININFPTKKTKKMISKDDFPFFSMRGVDEKYLFYNYIDSFGFYCFACVGDNGQGQRFDTLDGFMHSYLEDEIKVEVKIDVLK